MRRRISLIIWLGMALAVLAMRGPLCSTSPASSETAQDQDGVIRPRQTRATAGPRDWIRQRQQLLDTHQVVAVRSHHSVAAPGSLAHFGEPGYDVLLYVPDWETEDNVVPFRVLTGEPLTERLSAEDVERVRTLFPEAQVRTFAQAYRPTRGPCKFFCHECHQAQIELEHRELVPAD